MPENTYNDGAKDAVKWYQGRSGKVSSKRIAGLALIVCGMVVAVLSVILGYPEADGILWPVLSAGTLLLGAGVLERLGSTGSKDRKAGE